MVTQHIHNQLRFLDFDFAATGHSCSYQICSLVVNTLKMRLRLGLVSGGCKCRSPPREAYPKSRSAIWRRGKGGKRIGKERDGRIKPTPHHPTRRDISQRRASSGSVACVRECESGLCSKLTE